MILVSDYDDCAGPHSIGWQINMAYKHGPITSKSGAPCGHGIFLFLDDKEQAVLKTFGT